MKNTARYSIKSIDKALSILEIFSPENPQWSLKRIQNTLQMPKATTFRILYTLEKRGLLRKDPRTRNYRLGLKLVYFANLIAKGHDLLSIARPTMIALRDETGETVDCTILDHNQVLYIELLESTHRIKASSSQVGRKLPLHCTACGKVLAAFSKDRLSNDWPPSNLTPYTRKTITDPAKLKTELEKVRKQGYAIDRGELDDGIYAVSAPLFDADSNAIAALTIVAPLSRLDRRTLSELKEKVVSSAQKIALDFRLLL